MTEDVARLIVAYGDAVEKFEKIRATHSPQGPMFQMAKTKVQSALLQLLSLEYRPNLPLELVAFKRSYPERACLRCRNEVFWERMCEACQKSMRQYLQTKQLLLEMARRLRGK